VIHRPATAVVVGAGLAGPVITMFLARRGHSVTMLERRPDPQRARGGHGRSLMVILSARGWRTLDELGLGAEVRRISSPMWGRCAHLPDGDTHFTPYSHDHQPIWAVERERLARLLLRSAASMPGVTVHFDRRVTAVELGTAAVWACGDDGDDWFGGDLLFGCDGVHSAVRAQLVAEGAREETGQLDLAYQEINLSGPALDRSMMHYWPMSDALFGAFPTPDSQRFAGSVFLRLTGPAPSYACAPSTDALTQQFQKLFPRLAPHIPDLAGQLADRPISRVPLVRCDTWVHRDRVVLLGDAAHSMAPFMGQGMNCAFEDARFLIGCLDRFPDRGAALAHYQAVRRPDGDAITDLSWEHYRTMSRSPQEHYQDHQAVLAERLTSLFPQRYPSLYERCAFTQQSFASARRANEHLLDLARDLLHGHGEALLTAPDEVLRAHARATIDGRRRVP